MDEIVEGLWIGDLPSALDVEGLRAKNIYSVVTAMRGKVSIHATFNKYQINIDDSEDEDILVHLLPSISFIQSELDKGRGVLVHCQAGISRSSTIVAAYLMHSQKLDVNTAIEKIREKRPQIEPNDGFLQQLEVFHQASYKISRKDKAIRMFYMERAVEEVMKLATREHMLDHGQLGPPTPALPSLTPVASRRPSNDHTTLAPLSRRPSASMNVSISRRPSTNQPRSRMNSSSLEGRSAVLAALGGRGLLESLSMSALETEDEDQESESEKALPNGNSTAPNPPSRRPSGGDSRPFRPSPLSMEGIGRDLSDALDQVAITAETDPAHPLSPESEATAKLSPTVAPQLPSASMYASPADLAAQLSSNPKLAALRTPPGLSMTGLNGANNIKASISPPILMNPKCSGYFVEPMKWMEPYLEGGQLAGKLVCPNNKCGAKIGNYDWAGVCCGCKAWVTPGFCIHRSKVDEIVV
ncbi:hypothetical protein HYDPIDRAFT_30689 [Hydnomerulius pinastri MD-312]|uniref:protein-tyrosine-phosphatase n=1 Tax=Hydnomerulius pinastri MD-312 TaxID=994086 RepID=A0A0C9WCH6_9AGAM|nr:hypothetical protein HYDPIDRAFT_30689 [Hydnomerulius pinastri MD-312]